MRRHFGGRRVEEEVCRALASGHAFMEGSYERPQPLVRGKEGCTSQWRSSFSIWAGPTAGKSLSRGPAISTEAVGGTLQLVLGKMK